MKKSIVKLQQIIIDNLATIKKADETCPHCKKAVVILYSQDAAVLGAWKKLLGVKK